MQYVFSHRAWPYLEAMATIACLVQCALFPVLVTLLPLFDLSPAWKNAFEPYFVSLAVSFGMLAAIRGFFWHHHDKLVLSLFLGSLLVLFLAFCLSRFHSLLGEILHLSAICALLGVHVYNASLCKKCQKCRSTPNL